MRYIQELTLDVLQATKNKYIYAKQVDNDSRFLRITMMSGSTKIIPEENDSAIFRCEKPDKKSVLNPAAINQDGTVTVELTRQVLACTGTVKADVSIVNDNTVLSTVTFYIKVEKMPVTADQTVSSNEFLYLVEKVQEAEQFLKRGGTTGQVLKKKSNDDFDTEWGDDGGGGGSAIDVGAVPQVTGEFLYNDGSKITDQRWWNKTVQCTTNYQEYQAWYFYKIRNDGDGAVRTDVQPQPDIPTIEHIQKSGADLDDKDDVTVGNIYQCTSDYLIDKSSISNDTQFHQGYFYLYNGEQAQYTYTRTDTQPVPTNLSDLTSDSSHRLVTDAEKAKWNGKEDKNYYVQFLAYEKSNNQIIIKGYDSTATLPSVLFIPDFIEGFPVTEIYSQAFYNASFTRIILPGTLKTIKTQAFAFSSITELIIPDSVTTIEDRICLNCGSLAKVHIGAGLTSIGDHCFCNCSALTSVELSDNVTAFVGVTGSTGTGSNFYNCIFEDFVLPKSLAKITRHCFALNPQLKKIALPNVDEIGYQAFKNCSGLEKIYLSKKLTTVQEGAFDGCSGLVNVYYEGTQAEWNAITISSTGNSALTGANIHFCDRTTYYESDYDQTFVIPQNPNSTVYIEFPTVGLEEFRMTLKTPETVISSSTGYFYISTGMSGNVMNSKGRFFEPNFAQSHSSTFDVLFKKDKFGFYDMRGYKFGNTTDTDYSLVTHYSLARQNIGRAFFSEPAPITGIWFTVSGTMSDLAGATIRVRGKKYG